MPVTVMVGAQWGDEGKGKLVDLCGAWFDVVARFGGGANAGHTLIVEGEKFVFHLLPSGVLHANSTCVLGQGMVIDPVLLLEELEALTKHRPLSTEQLKVSEDAFLVLPHHKEVDRLREESAGAIGTTRRGIGPAYEDKVSRCGLQIRDLLREDLFRTKLETNLRTWEPTVRALGGELPSIQSILDLHRESARALAPYVENTRQWIQEARLANKQILLEGAQGTLLDIDHGTYPYVTSSSVVAGGACSAMGIGPRHIDCIFGVTKAYCTRVGEGPFPTEMDDDSLLRELGGEYGATTGRARRCGWLDLPLLRLAAQVNSLDSLAVTKLDVLSKLPELKLCVDYKLQGRVLGRCPSLSELANVEPVYETHAGWKADISECKGFEELPVEAQQYVRRIESLVGVSADILGVGPERHQAIVRRRGFGRKA